MSETNYYLEYVNEFVSAKDAKERDRVNKSYTFDGIELFDLLEKCDGKETHDLFDAYPAHQQSVERKKETINLNGFDVVPPITDRLPVIGHMYFVIGYGRAKGFTFEGYDYDIFKQLVSNGWWEKRSDAESFVQALFHPFKANYKWE